ncbi:MAG: hypothetical protein Fur0040_10450 [Sideroxydans sp.]
MSKFFVHPLLLIMASLVTGCAGFVMDYQNAFNRNFAFTASAYTGMMSVASEGVEADGFQNPNLAEYSAAQFPQVLFGMRSLDYHLTYYTRDDGVGAFHALLVPPGKDESAAIPVAYYKYAGKRFTWTVAMPDVARSFMIGTSYAAPYIVFDNKLLQQKYGSGVYTVIWVNTDANGKPENREMSRSSTRLIP